MSDTPEYCDRRRSETTGAHYFFRFHRVFLTAALFAITLAGCNESFQPLAENNHVHFSIYGALDASADTQKVRVTPVRGSILPESNSDPVNASVTLEHLGSGQKAILRDSLYSFPGSETFYARNYLTDMDLEPGESYRLVAEYADGRMSEATVTLPTDFPEPEYSLVCTPGLVVEEILLSVEDVEKLAAVTAFYYYRDETSTTGRQPVLKVEQYHNVRDQRGSKFVQVYIYDDLEKYLEQEGSGISHIRLDSTVVTIAGAGPDWPETEGLTVDEQVLANNVQNGIGYLGGIVTKSITFGPRCD